MFQQRRQLSTVSVSLAQGKVIIFRPEKRNAAFCMNVFELKDQICSLKSQMILSKSSSKFPVLGNKKISCPEKNI